MSFRQTRRRRRWLKPNRQFLLWTLFLLGPAYSESMASSQKHWVSLVEWLFPPRACFSLLGSVSHNAMPPGPGEGSWASCWVSHFNQFIIEMSMPSNWVQLGRTLWFTEKLLERNSFLAERPIVSSSWHGTGMVHDKKEPRVGTWAERTDSGTRGRLLKQTLLFNLESWEPINSPFMFGFEFSIY